MKITTTSQLAMSISLLCVIGLLGCSDWPAVKSKQNQEKAAQAVQENVQMTESEMIAESTLDLPELISESENVQEIIEPVNPAVDTMLSELNESENPASEFIDEAQSLIEKSEQQIKDPEDLNKVVKATPELIRKVQQALADAGFNPGTIDGINGPRTISALKNFQKQNNLAMGQLTKETLQKLEVSYQ